MTAKQGLFIAVAAAILAGTLGCEEDGGGANGGSPPVIVVTVGASRLEKLAAREIRRYIYLRTGCLADVEEVRTVPPGREAIIVSDSSRVMLAAMKKDLPDVGLAVNNLGAQEYLVRTVEHKGRRCVLVCGVDRVATLYAAYRFAEHIGARFYLHGDVVPDEQVAFAMPQIDEKGAPLFSIRGIQPFHDFPEGPDWWELDDYKAILAQLPKLRMNFLGLHTYPEGGVGPEPTVWIGLADDMGEDGRVSFSSRSSWSNTLRGNWGYAAMKTSDYTFGADRFFEQDDYGPAVMHGMMPWPQTPQQCNEVFDRAADMLGEAFTFARGLGIKTCVGTETPLIIPNVVKDRMRERGLDPADPAAVQKVYEGMFRRITRAYPLDYYWFWTPENWTWSNVKQEEIDATLADLKAAIAAAEAVDAPFTLATCGWVLGPPSNRALFDEFLPKEMPISCINRNVGFEPVEPGFADAKDRPKWAIPWLEDDPGMVIPQLWVGRMRRDAADALEYGCTGLLGIHWRTRILGPNVAALAHAAWHQCGWNPDFGSPRLPTEPPQPQPGRVGGRVATFPGAEIADTQDDVLYQTVLYDIHAYRFDVPNGPCKVTLRFCEPHYGETGKRVFGVRLEGKAVIEDLDIFAKVGKNRAMDYTFENVRVEDGLLDVDFVYVTEFPCIAAIMVEAGDVGYRINCGGPAHGDYAVDLPETDVDTRPRDMSSEDFYADWARAQFGPEAAEPVAALFTRLDGGPLQRVGMGQNANLPRPATWVDGPGGIQPDGRPWEQVSAQYTFAQEMEQWRPLVRGPGHLQRFDYWLDNFRYLRAMGKVNCTWARFSAAMQMVKAQTDAEARRKLAAETALPVRRELIADVTQAQRYLFATVNTTGSLGNVANWQQHIFPSLLYQGGRELAEALGEPLPVDAMPPTHYVGPERIVVPTVRTSLSAGEDLVLKVILPGPGPYTSSKLSWRPLGGGDYHEIPLEHVAAGVYRAIVAGARIYGDFEYHIKVESNAGGQTLVWPATAPRINQTVVIMD